MMLADDGGRHDIVSTKICGSYLDLRYFHGEIIVAVLVTHQCS